MIRARQSQLVVALVIVKKNKSETHDRVLEASLGYGYSTAANKGVKRKADADGHAPFDSFLCYLILMTRPLG